jgi:chemotaxis protein CheZ
MGQSGSGRLEAAVRRALRDENAPMFDELRRFLDRRVSELSAELHGAVQLMDYSEANLSGQLGRIHEQIASVIAAPANGMRGSGAELEAVVQATEDAANRIMEAAEAIDAAISAWTKGDGAAADLGGISEKITAIFEACSFQDLTSQRIRRAIEHLQSVESMLDRIIPAEAAPRPAPPPAANPATCDAIDQSAVDGLMGF